MNRKAIFSAVFLLALAFSVLSTSAIGMKPTTDNKMTPTKRIFVAHLSGRTWVSRVNSSVTYSIDTRAQGQAIFMFNKEATEIKFMLIAANIMNITMAHIHIDNGEALGPIVVWLYPRNPPPKEIPGRFDGVLAKGTITSANLIGPLEGMTTKDLMNMIQEGKAYTVVHTSQHPPGEIRGFIH